MGRRRSIYVGVLLASILFGSLGTVYARQEVRWARIDMLNTEVDDTVYLPSRTWLRAASLGYLPFASDLVFMSTHAYVIRHLYSDQIFRWLERYVDAAIDLDPDNPEIYYWASRVVRYGQIVDEPIILRSNAFAESAISRFPDDARFYEHLGFNKYFELRQIYTERERQLAAQLELEENPEERDVLLERLTKTRLRRYEFEGSALQDYTVAAMLPSSRVDKLFLLNLYVKQDERAAAAEMVKAVYADAPASVREQFELRLKEIDQSELASQLSARQKQRESHMPYVPEDLYQMLGSSHESRVPADWNQLGQVYTQALDSLKQREAADGSVGTKGTSND